MQIISPQFLAFTTVTLAVYYLLARKAQNAWLLLASIFFYITIRWEYAVAILALSLINYFIGQKVESRGWLRLGLTINIASFALLKLFSGPYGGGLAGLLHIPITSDALSLLLPIGFSFYILQAISYLLDIHRGQSQPARSYVDFALYLTYFPKLLAGPIERPARFLSRLEADRRVDNIAFARSVGLILVGILRKVILADRINALIPATVFSDPASFSSVEKMIWLLVFAFGLYNDFQGYTTIIRGVSGLFGIELELNFRQPFFAKSFSDFWTRWHISLSFWLRDYIFFPLRRWLMQHRWPAWIATFAPPLVTMLVSGYWHGAYLTMIGWGLLHGFYLIGEQILGFPRTHETNKIRGVLSNLFVFLLISLAWIPFATSSLRASANYALGIFSFSGSISTPLPLLDILPAFAASLWLDWQESKHNSDAFFMKWSPNSQAWGLAIAIWLMILFLGPQAGLVTFVYQGF